MESQQRDSMANLCWITFRVMQVEGEECWFIGITIEGFPAIESFLGYGLTKRT
jgi:hypothetical protein